MPLFKRSALSVCALMTMTMTLQHCLLDAVCELLHPQPTHTAIITAAATLPLLPYYLVRTPSGRCTAANRCRVVMATVRAGERRWW
jgi:hypothetical protein